LFGRPVEINVLFEPVKGEFHFSEMIKLIKRRQSFLSFGNDRAHGSSACNFIKGRR
jgi:hypothetical protein